MNETRNWPNRPMPMFPRMLPALPAPRVIPVAPVMPMVPPVPFRQDADGKGWAGGKDEAKAEKIKSTMKNFWEQWIEMQKSCMDSSRDQWDQFFEHLMDMQDTFAASLSDEAPYLYDFPFAPLFALSPRRAMKWMKKFEKMANAHLVELADSMLDFYFKSQEQVCDMAQAAMDSKENKDEPAQAEDGKDKPAKQ